VKYKLIASDMDGTLVNEKSELSQRTKDAIIKTVKAGKLFVTATGRPLCNVEIVNSLFDEDMPFIVFNGAAAYMGKSKKLLFEKYLGFDLAKEAFEMGKNLGIPQIVWTGPRLWASYLCKETEMYRDFSGTGMSVVDDLDTLKGKVEGISKVLWIDDPENVKRFSREMGEHFGERLTCLSSMAHFFEFVSREAGKGAALAEIGKLYSIDRSEMIAVGDGYNDVSMLEYAGFSVAMENAPDDIKTMCDHVTLSNNDDGVAVVIEKYILGE
jgi:hypothetical protein